MPSESQPNAHDADGLETAIDQAIAACGGDQMATTIWSQVEELKKAVSHAFVRGRFRTYSG